MIWWCSECDFDATLPGLSPPFTSSDEAQQDTWSCPLPKADAGPN